MYHMHIHTYIHTYMYTHVFACTHTHTRTQLSSLLYIEYAYMYTHINTPTQREEFLVYVWSRPHYWCNCRHRCKQCRGCVVVQSQRLHFECACMRLLVVRITNRAVTNTCSHVNTCLFVCVSIHVYVCVCVFTYVCVCCAWSLPQLFQRIMDAFVNLIQHQLPLHPFGFHLAPVASFD